jgi:hypothetical protein
MADFPPTLMHLSIQNQARGVSARLFPSRFTDFLPPRPNLGGFSVNRGAVAGGPRCHSAIAAQH